MRVNGSLTKIDLIRLYNSNHRSFEIAIDEIKGQLGWKPGRQRFYTKQIELIIAHLGPPILDIEIERV